MPKAYVKMRDSLKRQGKPAKVAKRIAAATYNKRRGTKKPITRKH